MKGYTFAISCPVCGSDLVHINSGEPDLSHAVAVALCPKCRKEVTITVQTVMRCRPVIEHGTERAYKQHLTEGTDPCGDCHDWKIRTRGKAKVLV